MNPPDRIVWTEMNGWVPATSPVVRATDRGYLYGQGVFETFRSNQGRFFRLELHLERMKVSAEVLGIKVPSLKVVLDALQSGLDYMGGDDAVFRITLTAGQGWPSRSSPSSTGLTLIARPFVEISVEPVTLSVSSYVRQTGALHTGKKTLNYLESALAMEEAKQRGCSDAVLLDDLGRVSETAVSNIFWIKQSLVFTPALFTGALPGIMRQEVLNLCKRLGIRTVQGGYPLENILRSDAIFVTNSVIGVKPVSQAGSITLPAASANEIFSAIKINLAEVIDSEARAVEDTRRGIWELL